MELDGQQAEGPDCVVAARGRLLERIDAWYEGGGAQLWERQSLTRARLVGGDPEFGAEVMAAIAECTYAAPWRPEMLGEIAGMRERLEASRPARDLKRGPGGLADVEFLVQLFQLKYGPAQPGYPTTFEAL